MNASRAGRTAIMLLGTDRRAMASLGGILALTGCDLPVSAGGDVDNGAPVFEAFNDRILASAGATASDWTGLNGSWMSSPKAAEFREQADAVLKGEFGGSYLFALADARLAQLIPFWTEVLAEAGIRPGFVISITDPVAAATMIAPVGRATQAAGQLLWLRTMLDAEMNTRGAARCFLAGEVLVREWREALAGIGEAFSLSWPRLPEQFERDAAAFLLDREPAEDVAVAGSGYLSDWVTGAYLVLSRWAHSGENAEDHAILDAIRDAFNDASATFSGLAHDQRDADGRIAALSAELARHKANMAAVEENASAVRNRLLQVEGTARDLQSEVETASHQLGLAREEARQAKSRNMELTEDARTLERELRGRISHLESALLQRQAEADEHASALVQSRNENAALMSSHHDALLAKDRELSQLHSTLAEQTAAREAAVRKTQNADAQLKDRYGEIVSLTRLLAEANETGSRSAVRAQWSATVARQLLNGGGGWLGRKLGGFMPGGWHRNEVLQQLKREGLFDADAYLVANPDVAQAGVDPLKHFIEHGLGEGRSLGLD